MDRSVLLAFGLAAAVTYGLRLGGLLLSARFPSRGRFRIFMDSLPGTILVSLVAPDILHGGALSFLAAGSTVVVAAKTRNVFMAMLVGVAIVAFGRHFLVG